MSQKKINNILLPIQIVLSKIHYFVDILKKPPVNKLKIKNLEIRIIKYNFWNSKTSTWRI
jgi:hypothetical protein